MTWHVFQDFPRTHPHEKLSAGQVVVMIGENVRQLLECLHAVSVESAEFMLVNGNGRIS